MLEQWGFLIAVAGLGFAYFSPLLQGLGAKFLPTASPNAQRIVTAVLGGAGVVLSIYLAEKFFGRRVKNI